MLRRAYAQTRAEDPGAGPTANVAAQMAIGAGDVESAVAALCLSERMSYDAAGWPDLEKVALLERVLDWVSPDRVLLRGRLLAQLAGELVFVGDFERRESILTDLRQLMDTIDDPVERWGLMGGG
ncbi:MAG: hypothetical protein M3445_09735, partial [Actinomycetota bacterium]|nr:hypothetical protein [Actinomycetota bacterium]